ncbi:MAG: hypothetical protein HY662_05040 [Chloroflexi bacterium]|nr:hypothetical protein [Chloroflexota bacterium]
MNDAIIPKLEDEIDAADGMASLLDSEGTISLETYLESHLNKSENDR